MTSRPTVQVDIYPLKIHLAESFYKVMWQYFFPEEEQDSQKRQVSKFIYSSQLSVRWSLEETLSSYLCYLQEVWKVSTTAGARRLKKGTPAQDGSQAGTQTTKDAEPAKSSIFTLPGLGAATQSSTSTDSSQVSVLNSTF